MSRRARTTRKVLTEEEEEPEITSGDEAEKEYERHADEPTDSDEVIEEKVVALVDLIKSCHTKLIYTGAGISTAANIPDYRGPTGVYTMAKKGVAINCHNIVSQSPTTSHLVIKELYRHRYISHIVSQNCDGMHLRSGLPQSVLSEIHGNMHIEVCSSCDSKQYLRRYDVTEDSGFRYHQTRRNCECGSPLRDTIVHYGERGKARFPLNWEAAQEIVPVADLIICIGSSLQVLKDYKFLWPAPGSTAKIVIINLQWTPKDKDAALVIRGDCEKILTKVADKLDIEIKHYCRDCDPILAARRNARNHELLMKLTDCTCHIRAPRTSIESLLPEEEKSDSFRCPGWWRVGMNSIGKSVKNARRSNSTEDSGFDEQNREPSSLTPPSPGTTVAKRGRPRKRKGSNEEGGAPSPKARKRRSGDSDDDDDYAPQRYQQRSQMATARSTRSSGAAEEQPLVGDFRKKRQDAGRRRNARAAEEVDTPVDPPVEQPPPPPPRPRAEPVVDVLEQVNVEGEGPVIPEINGHIVLEGEVIGGDIDYDTDEDEEEYEESDEDDEEHMNGEVAQYDGELVRNDVSLSSVDLIVQQEHSILLEPIKVQREEDDGALVDVVGDLDDDIDDNVPFDNSSFMNSGTSGTTGDLEEDLGYNGSELLPNSAKFRDPSVSGMMYNDNQSILTGSGASLAMSLSQLNDPNQMHQPSVSRDLGSLDVFDFREDSQHDMLVPRLGFDGSSEPSTSSFSPYRSTGGNYKKYLNKRYESECNYRRYGMDSNGASSSRYYEAAPFASNGSLAGSLLPPIQPSLSLHLSEPGPSSLAALQDMPGSSMGAGSSLDLSSLSGPSTMSTQQLAFAKKNQSASTSFTSPPRARHTTRLPRSKPTPDKNSVLSFLSSMNGGKGPTENTIPLGQVLEQARQIVDPNENEDRFRETMMLMAGSLRGNEAPPLAQPVVKVTKRGAKRAAKTTNQ